MSAVNRNDLPSSPVLDRLWPKVDVREHDECWPFVACINRHGYGRFGVGQAVINAHRVVLQEVAGAPGPDDQARHLCGNRACCNPAHLAWGNQSANEADKVAHGRSNRGERHGHSKLTRDDVLAIRGRRTSETQTALAAAYGVSQTTIWEITTGRTWAWLTAEGGDA